MPTPIVETPSKGDAINAPVGADVRNAASVRTPFTAVGNRLKFLENFHTAIKVFLDGGAATLAAGLVYTFTGSSELEIKGTSASLKLVEPYVRFGGKVLGQLFSAGQEGMANKKVLLVNTGSGALNVDADLYDTVLLNSVTGARQVILQSSTPGAHIKVISLVTGFACNLQRPSGGGQIGPDVRFTAGDAFVVEAVCCPDAVWRLAGYNAFSL